MANVQILDEKDLFRRLADEIARTAKASIKARDRFTFCLPGGSTPARLYEVFSAGRHFTKAEIQKTYFFFGDERDVSPESARSNFKLARDLLLRPLGVTAGNVVRWPTEIIDASEVAVKYDQAIRRFFKLEEGKFPVFDLVLLGIGDDCHTASLFPNTEGLKETGKIAVMNRVEKLDTNRLTLTFPVFNHARKIFFLVAGEEKAEAVRAALEEEQNCTRYPAQCIRPTEGELKWFLDKQAASGLSRSSKAKSS